ncbi:uncharacterized protein YndB with AHSA1/START domain [Spinactinospora alkalitolerans]|uniref:Uncharacterized protein YndB with AHSA1/START domain n=1 Tax=Spinactinospora alkalitolerans TaxID=687207 RepID=A0A852TX33_9ACTN|nr:SRPBCC family protein [Spinactinospora alkalitolerans]NYE47452.1 uncharacterized protein YndB with AHSA1/START domain [Spinactinospora alkalitolerans]
MSVPSVKHATFTLERDYPAPPARVFAMWADPAAKARWFAGPEAEHELDFRVGGHETSRGRNSDGRVLTFESVYSEIVPDTRIVYTSGLYAEETLATASLTTVQFAPTDEGTRLVVTEQGSYLDGHEKPAWREQGAGGQLAALDAEVRAAAR